MPASSQNVADQLIANAALQRQFELNIRSPSQIDGVPIELAIHLHDIHWNRQYHSFLLTYRPAYTRDLIIGGSYWSKFLCNAIFASACKFSDRPEVRDDPCDPRTAGCRFLRRCEELLAEESPFDKSSISTIIGLVLLSSAFLARGEVSKGWKYLGLAIRTVFDLGMHLDCSRPGLSAEDVEIRRRAFWGVFVMDKVQSLYLGRPFAIQLRDVRVPREFLDTLEEYEPWTPYLDPSNAPNLGCRRSIAPTPLHSVSCFQQMCALSIVMTKIMSRIYVASARITNASKKMATFDQEFTQWRANLPGHLLFEPVLDQAGAPLHIVAPNIVVLNTTYHTNVILLHRPFVSNKSLHQSALSKRVWDKCKAAAKAITDLVGAYREVYTLRGAPYLASYACYVACTIHVPNAAAVEGSSSARGLDASQMLQSTLEMLHELSKASSFAKRASEIIVRLRESNRPQNRQGSPAFTDCTPDSAVELNAVMTMFPMTSATNVEDFQISDTLPTFSLTQPDLGFIDDSLLQDPLYGFLSDFDPAFTV